MAEQVADKPKGKSAAKQCGVADEPVVVMKFRPLKPGDGVEDKTEMTGRATSGGR